METSGSHCHCRNAKRMQIERNFCENILWRKTVRKLRARPGIKEAVLFQVVGKGERMLSLHLNLIS